MKKVIFVLALSGLVSAGSVAAYATTSESFGIEKSNGGGKKKKKNKKECCSTEEKGCCEKKGETKKEEQPK